MTIMACPFSPRMFQVYKNAPYNQKVDVFSFGVVIFELFSRYLMLAAISMLVSCVGGCVGGRGGGREKMCGGQVGMSGVWFRVYVASFSCPITT